jgi:hypothetical protein
MIVATSRFTRVDCWFLNLRKGNRLSEFERKVKRMLGTKRKRKFTSRVHKLYNDYLHIRNMLSKFSPNITSLMKSWKREKQIQLSREREQNCTDTRLQSKYLRTGTLGRQKPESENSLVLNLPS